MASESEEWDWMAVVSGVRAVISYSWEWDSDESEDEEVDEVGE